MSAGPPDSDETEPLRVALQTFPAQEDHRRLRQLALDEDTSLQRLGLEASKMNLLRRAQGRFVEGREAAVSALRRAAVVASDETDVRIEGGNAYHWVFRSDEAVVYHAAPTRAAAVVHATMDGHRPAVWLSDRSTAQQGHGERHQTCLAALAREVTYAVEVSEDQVPLRLQLWLGSVFSLAERVTGLAASTLAAKRRALERRLSAILSASSRCDLTRALQAKISRARDQLLVFLGHPGRVAVTNNGCERALRPAVVQRKVTNGCRAMWAAAGEADGAHGRRHGPPLGRRHLRHHPQDHRRLIAPRADPLIAGKLSRLRSRARPPK